MKQLLCSLVLFSCACAFAQNPPVIAQPVNASSVTFPPIVPALLPIANAGVSRIGNPGPARYCYWIVVNYLVGNTAPTKVRPCITNGPVTLSVSNYDQVSFDLPPQAASVDILRTTGLGIDQAPQGSCACAVASGNTTGTVTDQSNSLSAYTVTTFDPSVLNIGLTNEVVGAGASHLKLRQNGVLVGDISALANGLADPGANGFVFRTAPNTTSAIGSSGTGNVILAGAPTFTANPTFAAQTGAGFVVLAASPLLTGNLTLNGSNFGVIATRATLDVTTSGGANSTVTSTPLLASTTYAYQCSLIVSPSATTNSLDIILFPGIGATYATATATLQTGAGTTSAALQMGIAQGAPGVPGLLAVAVGSGTFTTAGGFYGLTISGELEMNTAGNALLQIVSPGGGTNTAKRGASCTFTETAN
jgi:hypothetical protein